VMSAQYGDVGMIRIVYMKKSALRVTLHIPLDLSVVEKSC
jgi:hypothetical protein